MQIEFSLYRADGKWANADRDDAPVPQSVVDEIARKFGEACEDVAVSILFDGTQERVSTGSWDRPLHETHTEVSVVEVLLTASCGCENRVHEGPIVHWIDEAFREEMIDQACSYA